MSHPTNTRHTETPTQTSQNNGSQTEPPFGGFLNAPVPCLWQPGRHMVWDPKVKLIYIGLRNSTNTGWMAKGSAGNNNPGGDWIYSGQDHKFADTVKETSELRRKYRGFLTWYDDFYTSLSPPARQSTSGVPQTVPSATQPPGVRPTSVQPNPIQPASFQPASDQISDHKLPKHVAAAVIANAETTRLRSRETDNYAGSSHTGNEIGMLQESGEAPVRETNSEEVPQKRRGRPPEKRKVDNGLAGAAERFFKTLDEVLEQVDYLSSDSIRLPATELPRALNDAFSESLLHFGVSRKAFSNLSVSSKWETCGHSRDGDRT